MDHPDVEVIERKRVHDGFLQVDVYRLRHRKFDGGWTEPVAREVCLRGDAVGVVLYDPARDSVVLIEQFRVGAAAGGHAGWLTEIVAGMVGKGETPEEVARREAHEETGCTVREIERVCTFYPSPGAFTEFVTLFCGRVDSDGIGGIHGLDTEHEDIRVGVVPLDDALRLLDEDKLNNSITIMGLQWLARHRERLRAAWG